MTPDEIHAALVAEFRNDPERLGYAGKKAPEIYALFAEPRRVGVSFAPDLLDKLEAAGLTQEQRAVIEAIPPTLAPSRRDLVPGDLVMVSYTQVEAAALEMGA